MQTAQSLMAICGLPRLEALMLLEVALNKPREWLLAHDTDVLPPELAAHFLTLAAQRRQGTPMAHLAGHREFMGHRFVVSPDVLIPRPETELLVEMALQKMPAGACSLLDLGTGSGAVAISIALARPEARVVATDLSPSALDIAQKNAKQLDVQIQLWQGSWYEALPSEGRFEVIVSNPPYIASGDPHLAVGDLRFEPITALTDGADGLMALRHIVEGAPQRLSPKGSLWLEHGFDQSQAVRQLLVAAGFSAVETKLDLAGLPRVTGGTL